MDEIQRREWGRRREMRRKNGGEKKGNEESHLLGFYLVRDTLLDVGFVSFSYHKATYVPCFHRR